MSASDLPSLWDFALAFYAKPSVAEACLNLQDAYNGNVCLLISLRWLDERKEYLPESELKNLESHIQLWTQQVVEPLRTLRRLLKQPLATYVQDDIQTQLRMQIKESELLAEKKLLAEIEFWLTNFPALQKLNSSSNVESYLKKLNVPAGFIDLIQ